MKNFKGFAFDIAIISWTILLFGTIILIVFSLMWLTTRTYINTALTPYNSLLANTPVKISSATVLGNSFFLNAGDSIIILMYFMLILASFLSARSEGSDSASFVIGLAMLLVGIIVSFPLSDFGHFFLTNAQVTPAATYYKGSMYLIENMPIIVAVSTFVYLLLVATNKKSPQFPSVGGGGGNAPIVSG